MIYVLQLNITTVVVYNFKLIISLLVGLLLIESFPIQTAI